MAGIKRINAVFIYVGDMAAMRKFYEDILQLGSPVVESDLWVEYELGGSNLALHQGDPRILAKQDVSKNSIRFSMEVADIDSFCKELQAKGVVFTFGPKKDFGSLLAEFKDPEGNLLRVIQYR